MAAQSVRDSRRQRDTREVRPLATTSRTVVGTPPPTASRCGT